jgi:hypothetical protein
MAFMSVAVLVRLQPVTAGSNNIVVYSSRADATKSPDKPAS